MDTKNGEFLKRLRATFRIEAGEHVRAMSTFLMELEKAGETEDRAKVTENLFREAHSLKGAARSVNLAEIETLCQALEAALFSLKKRNISLDPALLDLLHQTVNCITLLVPPSETEPAKTGLKQTGELVSRLNAVAKGAPIHIKPENSLPQTVTERRLVQADTVRIPVKKLDPLLLQAEEMIYVKMAAEQRVRELQEISGMLDLCRTDEGLKTIRGRIDAATRAAEQDLRALRRMVDEHLEAMKSLIMLPVSTLVEIFPKMVRDLAHAQGKEVELIVHGAEIKIDKRILDELKDPLIHIFRNCVDHGMKKPEERAQLGKSPSGTIRLCFAAKDNRQMEISISDDGTGIDLTKVRAAAIKQGLLAAGAAQQIDSREALEFIFHSGISTSPMITDISGRGLGLAIVREKAEKLGGSVSVESRIGDGTALRLVLPMTLATFMGVLVRADESLFVLPAVNVERVLRVKKEDIKTVENRETIRLDGQVLSMARLSKTLELPVAPKPSNSAKTSHLPVIVLAYAGKRMAFMVDEVLQEQEVLVKGLGPQLESVRNIAGATILGTGKVVPVLNVADLIKSAIQTSAAPREQNVVAKAQSSTGRILVAEDSITSRTLLKNILETAGYQVATAVDGVDALTQVRSNEFDLVVLDVDMPRMNGFELTTKIRADKKLSDLPVVLVTALESREDKERGIDAGANAYIVKSSFDQSNLLAVIQKLI